jgi:hypothetical protein
MNSEMNNPSGAAQGAARPTRRARRVPRAATVGLLALATVMGVRLGLDAPEVSPVSPPALAARYGAPPAPPAETVAGLGADLAAVSPPVMPAGAAGDAAATPAEELANAPGMTDRAQETGGRGESAGHQRNGRDGGRHERSRLGIEGARDGG